MLGDRLFRTIAVTLLLVMPLTALAQSVTIEGGAQFASLPEALAAATEGDVLLVEGRHQGNFVLDRRLALYGSAGAVLDGAGQGTVVTITADDVLIEGLTITGSGRSESYWQAWGPTGIRVEGDRAVLSGLDVSENGWGVLFRAGSGSELHGSRVTDNQRDGVVLLGGADHRITGNEVLRNRIGIKIDPFTGDNDRVLLPLMHDLEWTQRVAEIQATAVPALRHVIADNLVRGNANTGIWLQFHVREARVERNLVHATGIERAPDATEHAFWQAEMRSTLFSPVETAGSGIGIFCWPEDNLIAENAVYDNLALGIYLTIAERNTITANRIERNAIGIEISAAEENEIVANTVQDNRDFGIRAGGWMWMGQGRPDRNLIWLNDLVGNGVNAFDGSDRLLSTREIADHIALMPWPEQMRIVYENPTIRLQMAQMMVGQQRAAHNRWDDGTHGNRHDDFDEPHEGFVDRDGDGIGEVGRQIPGGGAVDRFPLTAEALKSAIAARVD